MTIATASKPVADEAEQDALFAAHSGTSEQTFNLETVMRIPVTVQVVLGSVVMPVSNLMKLGRGAVVALDNRIGEPVDIVVNGRVVARGEVVVVDDETSRFGVSLTELVGPSSLTSRA